MSSAISQNSSPKRRRVSRLTMSALSAESSEPEDSSASVMLLSSALALPLPFLALRRVFRICFSRSIVVLSCLRSILAMWLSRARYFSFWSGRWEIVSAAKVRLSICSTVDRSLIRMQMNCSAIRLLNPGSCCIKTCCKGVLIVIEPCHE